MDRRKSLGLVSLLAVLMACWPGGVLWAQASGLAPTPPMGWNSWDLYLLKINDGLIRAQAKALVDSGMKAAGYNYVVIDGGWEGYHDADGRLSPQHPQVLRT